MDGGSPMDRVVTRRNFLKGAGVMASMVGVTLATEKAAHSGGGEGKKPEPTILETEVPKLSTKVLMVDTVMGVSGEGVSVAGKGKITAEWVELATGAKDGLVNRAKRALNPKEVSEKAGWYAVMEKFGRHGQEVSTVMTGL